LSQALKVAHLAQAFHRKVAPHFCKEIDVQLLAAIPNGLFLEYFPWSDDLPSIHWKSRMESRRSLPDRG
jgi:L-alanine-DL-glutamate epimerase-like enolase superfamily enzyme